MLHFMQLAHIDIYVQNSKHKSQNTESTSFEHRTQNICIQKTMSHIGFRKLSVLILQLSDTPVNVNEVGLVLKGESINGSNLPEDKYKISDTANMEQSNEQ